MRFIVVFMLLTWVGCASTANQGEIDKCEELCAPNGGMKSFRKDCLETVCKCDNGLWDSI